MMRPLEGAQPRSRVTAAMGYLADALPGQSGKPVAMVQSNPRVAALAARQSRVDDRAVLETYRACGSTAELLKTLQHRPMPKRYRPVVQQMAPAHTRPGFFRHNLAVACQMAVDVGAATAGVFVGGGYKNHNTFTYLRSNGCSWPAIVGAYVLLSCVIVVPLLALL